MTEDQANLTRCCGPEGCGGNAAGEGERFCLASRCMGWRFHWMKQKVELRGPQPVDARDYKWVHSAEGFCGLAGQP